MSSKPSTASPELGMGTHPTGIPISPNPSELTSLSVPGRTSGKRRSGVSDQFSSTAFPPSKKTRKAPDEVLVLATPSESDEIVSASPSKSDEFPSLAFPPPKKARKAPDEVLVLASPSESDEIVPASPSKSDEIVPASPSEPDEIQETSSYSSGPGSGTLHYGTGRTQQMAGLTKYRARRRILSPPDSSEENDLPEWGPAASALPRVNWQAASPSPNLIKGKKAEAPAAKSGNAFTLSGNNAERRAISNRPTNPLSKPERGKIVARDQLNESGMEDKLTDGGEGKSRAENDESSSVSRADGSNARGLRRQRAAPPVINLNNNELLFSYPPLNITRGDLCRLEPGEFLNDTIIEFALKYTTLRPYNTSAEASDLHFDRHWHNGLKEKDPHLADDIWVFNSFFYKKLINREGEGYPKVKKWTARVNIFSKKFIIVPINEDLHWYLAIIYQPGASLRTATRPTHIENPDAEAPRDVPCPHPLRHASSDDPPNDTPTDDLSPDEGESRDLPLCAPRPLNINELGRNFSLLDDASRDDIPLKGDKEVIGSDDPKATDSEPRPTGPAEQTYVFILDSLGGAHPSVSNTLAEWLLLEAQDKQKVKIAKPRNIGKYVNVNVFIFG
ncbi:hypothetical protein FS837_004520 [Tulasnella sp. UAMH 9824]|nr:hypothetical protein FS837_004520 [Tulasnella sp. UAMH 9824]